MNSFFAALEFLTLFPCPDRAERPADELGRAAIFFPLVGLLLGAILVVVDFLLSPFASPALTGAILIAILALLTGGLHLDALGDTFDGLGAGGDRQRILQVMDDSRTGAFGVIAIGLTLFLKIHALQSMDAERWRALLAAPVLGRWSMVLMGCRAAAAKPGLGATFIEHLSARRIVAATLLTALAAAAILRAGGVVLMICLATLTLLCKHYFRRRLGGVTGDILGAVGEWSETSALVLLALATK